MWHCRGIPGLLAFKPSLSVRYCGDLQATVRSGPRGSGPLEATANLLASRRVGPDRIIMSRGRADSRRRCTDAVMAQLQHVGLSAPKMMGLCWLFGCQFGQQFAAGLGLAGADVKEKRAQLYWKHILITRHLQLHLREFTPRSPLCKSSDGYGHKGCTKISESCIFQSQIGVGLFPLLMLTACFENAHAPSDLPTFESLRRILQVIGAFATSCDLASNSDHGGP
jgi:hypothetical protein